MVTLYHRVLRSRLLVVVVALCCMVLVNGLAFAQTATPAPTATPSPDVLTTTSIFAGANDLISTYGLAALISVAAFIGVMFMLIRRAKRAAM